MDLLAYQVREIEVASPRPGETEVEARGGQARPRRPAAARAGLVGRACARGRGRGRCAGAASAELRAAGEVDRAAGELAARAFELSAAATELAVEVRTYRERLELDPARLQRSANGSARSTRSSASTARARRRCSPSSTGHGSLDALAGVEQERERAAAVAERTERVAALATAVSDGRDTAAPELTRALQGELGELGMEGASIEVTLVPNPELGSGGAEHAAFVFSAAPEQPSQPLAKVASGGELSRTMLACRSVLVDLDDVPTLIFDEVDAGIGGLAGVAVGRRLANLALSRQVVVVTHLPQIASFADRHPRPQGGRDRLGRGAGRRRRVEELSRMLAGLPGSARRRPRRGAAVRGQALPGASP